MNGKLRAFALALTFLVLISAILLTFTRLHASPALGFCGSAGDYRFHEQKDDGE